MKTGYCPQHWKPVRLNCGNYRDGTIRPSWNDLGLPPVTRTSTYADVEQVFRFLCWRKSAERKVDAFGEVQVRRFLKYDVLTWFRCSS